MAMEEVESQCAGDVPMMQLTFSKTFYAGSLLQPRPAANCDHASYATFRNKSTLTKTENSVTTRHTTETF